jgi:hypothetical protein
MDTLSFYNPIGEESVEYRAPLRIVSTGYFWIEDADGRRVMLPWKKKGDDHCFVTHASAERALRSLMERDWITW